MTDPNYNPQQYPDTGQNRQQYQQPQYGQTQQQTYQQPQYAQPQTNPYAAISSMGRPLNTVNPNISNRSMHNTSMVSNRM